MIFQKKFGSLLRTFLIRATFYKRSCCHFWKSLAWPRGAPNWAFVDLTGLKGVFFNKEQKISWAQRGFVSEKNAKQAKNWKNLVSWDLYIYIYIGTKIYFFLLFPFFPFSPLPSFPLFPFSPWPGAMLMGQMGKKSSKLEILVNALGNGFPPLKSADVWYLGLCQLTSADISWQSAEISCFYIVKQQP